MRYTDRLTIVTESEGGYNPTTGVFDDASTVSKELPANISQLGVERTVQLFGELDKTILVARLQRPYRQPYDYCVVDGKKYNVKRHIPHRRESVFYLEGATL